MEKFIYNQLCKVESIFLWNKYLPKNTWSLAANNKLQEKGAENLSLHRHKL